MSTASNSRQGGMYALYKHLLCSAYRTTDQLVGAGQLLTCLSSRSRRPAATPSAADSEEEASEAASDGADDPSTRDLEHLEDGAPMGQGRGTPDPLQPDDEIRHADLGLPSLPLRRGADQWLARLPNFLSYRHQPFDTESFDPDEEDMDMKRRSEKEQVRVADPGLRSVIASTCTIRWRYGEEKDEDGFRVSSSVSVAR